MRRIKIFSDFLIESNNSKVPIDYPARYFSRATGIKVYQDWSIPGDDQEVQDELVELNKINSNESWVIQPIRNLWRKFVALNPQIEKWIVPGKGPLDEATQKWEIMFGMVSKYNEDDIRSFLTRKGYDATPGEKERVKAIEKKTKNIIRWVPSLKTLKYIEDSL